MCHLSAEWGMAKKYEITTHTNRNNESNDVSWQVCRLQPSSWYNCPSQPCYLDRQYTLFYSDMSTWAYAPLKWRSQRLTEVKQTLLKYPQPTNQLPLSENFHLVPHSNVGSVKIAILTIADQTRVGHWTQMRLITFWNKFGTGSWKQAISLCL